MRVHVGVWLLALLVAGTELEASILCGVDQRVQAGTCDACDLTKMPFTNTAGDVKTSGDTECDGNLFGTSATWEQVDDAVLGSGAGFSRNVSISSDGTRIAVIYKDGTDGSLGGKGVVVVYEHNSNAASGSQWQQLGQNIESEAAGDGYHASISLSGDGNRLAVGSPDNMNPALNANSGHVRVFELISNAWSQLGGDIDGQSGNNFFGTSVSLSSDGGRLAVGLPGLSKVRVFEWLSASITWTQLGADISSTVVDGGFGNSVSLSADGARLIIGQPEKTGSGVAGSGHIKVLWYNGGTWDQFFRKMGRRL